MACFGQMRLALPILVGLLTSLSALGFCWGRAYVWFVCPQALVVMFVRQGLSPFDSIGAPDYPDITVALLYYPTMGWFVSQARERGTLRRTTVRVAVGHAIAIIAAFAAMHLRNKFWGW